MQQAFILKLCKQTLFQRVSTRYGQQAELKEQNQHLVATNEELKKNLTDAQVHKRQKIFHFVFIEPQVDTVGVPQLFNIIIVPNTKNALQYALC